MREIIEVQKLQLPITENTISQYHAYKTLNHQLMDSIQIILEEFPNVIETILDKGKVEGEKLIVDIFQADNFSTNKADDIDSDDILLNELKNDKLIYDKSQIEVSYEKVSQENETQLNERLMKEIYPFNEKNSVNLKDILSLIKSPEKRETLRDILVEKFTIKPEEMNREEVLKTLRNIETQTKQLYSFLEKNQEESSNVGKTIQNLSQNIQFINDINLLYTYMQLPLKLTEYTANSELYVYSNKKNLADIDGEISALLHLDMEHLVGINIYVLLNHKNVSIRFTLEKEENLIFLEKHLSSLTERLEKKGYNLSYNLEIKESKENIILQEMLEQKTNKTNFVEYSFEARV